MAVIIEDSNSRHLGLVEMRSNGTITAEDQDKCSFVLHEFWYLINEDANFRTPLSRSMTKEESDKLYKLEEDICKYMNEANEGGIAKKIMYFPDPNYFRKKALECSSFTSNEDRYEASKRLYTEFTAALQNSMDLNSHKKNLNQINSNKFLR